jgi:diguanylate cyclase (GGDEF)-like protein
MDTHTLVVMNVLLYVLYSGMILVNARTTGIEKGAVWFAGANLSRAGALLLMVLAEAVPVHLPVLQALGGLVAVCGVMMLHFSFMALLGRGPVLRPLQYVLMVMTIAAMVYLLLVPSRYPAELLVTCAIVAVQVAATASIVFLFSGDEVGPAAWLTGVALFLYTLLLLARVAAILRYNPVVYPVATANMTRIWLMGLLLTNSMIAFGFMFLSAAKLRMELLWHAQADQLTGLLNRWALARIALREIARCGRTKGSVATVMMDLDGLKTLNDTMGHGCGDAVLQAIAGVLRETVRGQDAVARMGGDEFCILLPDTGLAEAVMAAERMRAQVDMLVLQYRGETVRVRASLGVASSEICGLSWQNLVEQSDAALYRAKRGGRNRVVAAEMGVLGEEGV